MSRDTESKVEKRRKEAYKRRKSNYRRDRRRLRPSTIKKLVGSLVAVVVVIAVVFTVFINGGLARRMITAVKIGDTSISVAEYSYYYNSTFSSYYYTLYEYSEYYGIDMTGIDTTVSLTQQDYSDGYSYAEYFSDSAIDSLQFIIALYEEAMDAGYELTEEEQLTYEETLEDVLDDAEDEGMDIEEYVVELCGKGYTWEMYQDMLYKEMIAYDYQVEVEESFEYTDEELEEYYEENKESYAKVDFRYQAFETAEAEEETETTEATEEVTLEDAYANAEAFMDGIEDEDDFSAKVIELAEEELDDDDDEAEDDSLVEGYTESYVTSMDENLAEWLFEDGRGTGDMDIIENEDGDGYYVVYVVTPEYRDEYYTRDVRHILITVDDVDDEDELEEALETANDILDEWLEGDATEETFAELAETYSEDTGSNEDGGLYEDVEPGDMVDEFDEWLFDSDREEGDYDIILTDYGYHIMYYVGENDTEAWKLAVDEDMRDVDYDEWYDEIIENYDVKTFWLGIRLRTEPLPA